MTTVVQNGSGPSAAPTIDPSENPLHRLTDEQTEAIGKEFDELHEQIKADLGDRDATYIRSMIAFQRRLALIGRAELIASRWRAPWLLGAGTLGLSKILENMEIGHNVMHGQWDWMNDPVINSRSWDWDTASTAEAWRHSHNFIHHTYTNIVGKDRDLGYEIMRIDPGQKWYPFYLLQPFYNIVLASLFEWGVAFHDLDFNAIHSGEKDMKQAESLLSQLIERRSFREPFKRILTANVVANLIRNVWSYAIIFCGHFPDQTYTFTQEETDDETRGGWYVRQLLGAANIDGGPMFHVVSGNLGYLPDAA